ncbi:ankyrin repeat-containing domain protein [Mariannaea sp. PMI_226]|nr:ankyrin repeat-containing domain protein [Mariannaea sp. PMI_226]
MPIRPPKISPDDWKRYESTIQDLYYDQCLPLHSKTGKRSVVQVMRDEYKFSATPSQYEAQFNKWDCSKNVKKSDWKLILPQLDHLRGQNIEVRVRVSGKIVKEERLKRARRHVRPELVGSSAPSSAWLSMSEYSHICIETQDASGEWLRYSPPNNLELPSEFGLPISQNHPTDLGEMEGVIPDESGIIGRGDIINYQEDISAQMDWPIVESSASLGRMATPFPPPSTSPTLRFHTSFANWPDVFSQMSTGYQLGLDMIGNENLLSPNEYLRDIEFPLLRVPSPAALALPSSQHFVSLLLQDASISISNRHELFDEGIIQLPTANEVLGRLQSLIPQSLRYTAVQSASPESELGGSQFEGMLPEIMMYSIANNFAGFRGVPIGSIFKLLRSQPQMSSKVLEYMHKCPASLKKSFIGSLFRAAIEACDAQAVKSIFSAVENTVDAIDPDEIICEFRGRMLTAVELAANLRSIEVVQFLVNLGADVNKTCAEEAWMDQGALEHALPLRVQAYDPIDPDLIRVLLRAGARVRVTLFIRLTKRVTALELQREAAERLLPDTEFMVYLSDIVRYTDKSVALGVIRKFLGYCEDAMGSKSIAEYLEDELRPREARNNRILPRTLIEAAKHGNLALCTVLLKYTSATSNALSAAIYSGNRAVIDLMLDHGADVQGVPALIHFPRVPDLIQDPDPNPNYKLLKSQLGTTPLAEAIRSKNISLLLLVDSLGAWKCLSQDSHLQAALGAAVDANDTNMIARLLSRMSKPSFYHSIMLTQAISQGNTPGALRLLAAGVSVNLPEPPPPSTPSALLEAIKQRNTELLNIILDSDVRILETKNIYKGRRLSSIMEAAALWGEMPVIKEILYMGFEMDKGADTTALAAAVKKGDENLVELFLTSGADPSACAVNGISPLHEAVRRADQKMTRHLLSWGADPADEGAFVEAMENQGGSLASLLSALMNKYPFGCPGFGADLLIKAIEKNDMELLQTFLSAKMDKHGFSSDGKCTPLSFAIRHQGRNKIDAVRCLLDAGVRVNEIAAAPLGRGGNLQSSVFPLEPALLVAIETGNEAMVRFILEKGGDLNQPAQKGVKRTPLQKACEKGNLKIVKLLLGLGAKVNDPPARRGGGTALQLASGTGSISIVELLLLNGAKVHAATSDVNGRSALEAAAENGCISILKILWDAKSGVGFQPDEVKRAIEFAKTKGHKGCVEYLAQLWTMPDSTFRQSNMLSGMA